MDKNKNSEKIMHDLKESNLKVKILLQMIQSNQDQSSLEYQELVKQLKEELKKSTILAQELS